MDRDYFMTADEAAKVGLVDRVVLPSSSSTATPDKEEESSGKK